MTLASFEPFIFEPGCITLSPSQRASQFKANRKILQIHRRCWRWDRMALRWGRRPPGAWPGTRPGLLR